MWLWISLNPMSSDYAMNHILHINTVKMRMIVFKNNYTFFVSAFEPYLYSLHIEHLTLVWLGCFLKKLTCSKASLVSVKEIFLCTVWKKVIWYPFNAFKKTKYCSLSQNVTLTWRVICLFCPPQIGYVLSCRLLTTLRFLFSKKRMNKWLCNPNISTTLQLQLLYLPL